MTVEYRLLGPVEVLIDGRPVNLGGRKQRSVLATLALRVNEVVSSERLMNAVWGDEGADRATNNLQVYIYNLRRLLEPGAGKGAITSRPPGYVLNADVGDVDAARFERLVSAARARSGDPEGASDSYREADACWQGGALADLATEPFAAAEITRLESLRVDALEERIELDLGLGRHRQLVGELEALIALHPFRERLYAQLMVALYRSGRQADALAAFAEARRALVEELGISPSRLLQDLERAVLTQAPALDAPATPPSGGAAPDHPGRPDPSGGRRRDEPGRDRSGAAPGDEPRRRDRVRVPVPRAMSSFVGRAADREQVMALLRVSPLVSLVGPGGAGKTRLALEVAAAVTDGLVDDVVFTELAGITEPGQVASRVADGLGLAALDDSPATVAGDLADRRTLLVLDTCEHVLDGVAGLVEEVLSRAPECRVLATTREVLGVPAELVWLVGPLPVSRQPAPPPSTRSGRPRRSACSSSGPRPPIRPSCCRPATPWPSAIWSSGSTGCRWPSSWRPPGSARCHRRRSPTASMTGCPCCARAAAAGWPATRRYGPPSTGATPCCSPRSRWRSARWRSSPPPSGWTQPRPSAARPSPRGDRRGGPPRRQVARGLRAPRLGDPVPAAGNHAGVRPGEAGTSR